MNSHLTAQQLLAYLDGELSQSEARKAAEHLHSCWTCRSEVERLKSDIATILDAQKEAFSPALPPPPRPWPSFKALLARNRPNRPVSWWIRLGMRMNMLLGPIQVFMVVSTVAILGVLVHSLLRSQPVFAREVLQRMEIADTRRTTIPHDQVIRERVHIRKKAPGQSLLQSANMETWKSSSAVYWNTPEHDPITSDLRARYTAHHVPTALPLTAASVRSWEEIAGGQPTLTERGGDVALSFPGSANDGAGSVKRVSLLVQRETWQVRQMTLEFSDASFELTEDEFSVMPLSAVPQDLLAHLEPQLPPQMLVPLPAHTLTSPAASLAAGGSADLDKAMLAAFLTLHHLNADLGEPVTVTHFRGEAVVGLWQLPTDRQKELAAALADIPNVKVQLTEPGRETSAGVPAPARFAKTNATVYVATGSSIDDQRLAKAFATPAEEQEFTRQSLLAITTILSHLYALRNLEQQFSPEQEQSLTHEERTRLSSLVRDHAISAEAGLQELEARFAPLNAAFGVVATEPSQKSNPTSWQSGSLHALETAKVADHLLRSMLTANQTPVAPEAALPQIEQNLSHIQTELTACCTHAL